MSFHVAGAPSFDPINVEKELEKLGKDLTQLGNRLDVLDNNLAEVKRLLNELTNMLVKPKRVSFWSVVRGRNLNVSNSQELRPSV